MKLHIGCGQKYLPGYKHLDVLESEHIDFVCDAGNLEMIDSESVNEIYACHILEHFRRDQAPGALEEWCRVLVPGGVIRIAVPDFEAIVDEYHQNRDAARVQGLLYGGQNYDYNFHFVAYDFEMLERLLQESGFDNVARYDWRDFLPQDYDDFSRAYMPHMDFENGRLMSLNVVATKKQS